MPSLVESLQGRDLGHLRIIAEFWGIQLDEQEIQAATQQLASQMLISWRVEQLFNQLSSREKEALIDLARHAGRLPWAQLTRLYGEVREMGVARRDREMPYKQPISPVEALGYRGIIARAFFDTPSGPEEFAYIPDDLLPKIPLTDEGEPSQMGRRAYSSEYAQVYPARDVILDHACTLLAALRLGISLPGAFSTRTGEALTPQILKSMLSASGLLDEAGMPVPEPVRIFLEAPRGEALASLVRAWRLSKEFNELGMLPNLSIEGIWKNNPLQARQSILDFLANIPPTTWWSLEAFISAIKKTNPDFQRPGGDYDSWFIRNTTTDDYLRGFESWEAVEGRLIRFLLTGPLYWMGILDLASPELSGELTAFRLSAWSSALLNGEPPKGMPAEQEPLVVRSDARISARRLVPRRVRYQLARFCEWGKETPDEYQYQVTPASLTNARKQGLAVGQLVSLLNRSAKAVPPSLVKALERWEKNGSEARMEKMIVLRVASTEVLQALRRSRLSRYLGEPIGPMAIVIKEGAAQKVLGGLAELGYLGEIRGEAEDS